MPQAPAARHRLEALLVLLVLAAYAVVQHAGLGGLGFVSDAWDILFQAGTDLRTAVSTPLGYHYVPVFSAFVHALGLLFGGREALYACSQLALLVLVAWLAFLLGRRLLGQALPATLGALLLVGSAAHHEVTYWLLVGHQHLLAATFTLLGLLLLPGLAGGPRDLRRSFLFAALAAAACFVYEGSLTLLPTAAVWSALLMRRREPAGARVGLARELIARLWPCVLVALLVLAGQLLFHEKTAAATSLGFDSWRRYLLVRSLVAIFSLQGSHDHLRWLVSGGGLDASANARLAVGVWLVLAGAAAALVFWRVRALGPRLLLAWLALHLGAGSLVVGLTYRHHFLPGVPALLLLAHALSRAGQAVARHWPAAAALDPGLPLAATLLLLVGAQPDLARELALYRRATAANRSLVDATRAGWSRRPGAVPIYVNGPTRISADGIGVNVLDNAPHALWSLRLSPRPAEWARTPEPRRPDRLETGRVVSLVELHALAADPGRLVLLFDDESAVFREIRGDDWPWPERYTPATAPYLAWQPGPTPFAAVPPGPALELPLRRPSGARSWVAVRLRVEPESDLRLAVTGGGSLSIAPAPGRAPRWRSALLPAGDAGADQALGLEVQGRSRILLAHAWSFAPPARYTPETAPFLSWSPGAPRSFVLDDGLELPFDPAACGSGGDCQVEVEYRAEPGCQAELEGEGVRVPVLVSSDSAAAWQRVRLPVAGAEPLLRVRSSGSELVRARDVHVLSAADRPPVGAGGGAMPP